MLPFGIGFSEVLLILVVVLLVVGPKKLPEIARTLGKGVRAARRAGQELRDAVQLDEIRRNVYDHTARPWQQAADIEDAVIQPPRPPVEPNPDLGDPTAPDPLQYDDLYDPDEAAPSGPVGRGPGPNGAPLAPVELPPRPDLASIDDADAAAADAPRVELGKRADDSSDRPT